MTDLETPSDVARAQRLKRMRMRCWRRGTREMDLLLGGYFDDGRADFSDADLDALEALMEIDDQTLFAWTSGAAEPADEHRPLIEAIQAAAARRPRP